MFEMANIKYVHTVAQSKNIQSGFCSMPILFRMYTNIAGIGNAIAKALAAGGAETIALSRTQEDLDQLKAEVFCLSY